MNKILFILGFIIAISLLTIMFVLKSYLSPLIDTWIIIVLVSFTVVIGFLLGIKLMSSL
jgi:hypothetical protein